MGLLCGPPPSRYSEWPVLPFSRYDDDDAKMLALPVGILLVVGALSREELCPPAGITVSFELPAVVTRLLRLQLRAHSCGRAYVSGISGLRFSLTAFLMGVQPVYSRIMFRWWGSSDFSEHGIVS